MPEPNPLRVHGHVGVTTDGGRTIFGFGPHISDEEERKGDPVDRMLNGETFPGAVTNDTAVFIDVHEHPFVPGGDGETKQIVYKKDYPVTAERLAEINATLQAHAARPELPDIRYGFAVPGGTGKSCATYPAVLGILPLPHPRGAISSYIPALQAQGEEWHPPE